MLETLSKPLQMCVSVILFYFCLWFRLYCMQSPSSMWWHILHIRHYVAYICILYIFAVLVHIIFFRTSFAQRMCNKAPYLLCQRMYCVQCCLMSNWTWYLCMKVTNVPVTLTWLVRPWNLPWSPAERDGDQRLILYWIDPVDAADRLTAKPELAEFFYFHYERQEL